MLTFVKHLHNLIPDIVGFAGLGGLYIQVTKRTTKHYLSELKPNSGSSMRDEVNRQGKEIIRQGERIDGIYEFLLGKAENGN